MKTGFRYMLLVILAAGIAAGVYQIGAMFLPDGWPKVFLMFAISGAWGLGFVRWLWALINDERDPLAINNAD